MRLGPGIAFTCLTAGCALVVPLGDLAGGAPDASMDSAATDGDAQSTNDAAPDVAGDVGSEIELPVKAAFADGGELVSGATLKATILGNGRGEKVLVFKFKRKKQYKKTIGHRQSFTEVKVGDIVA